MSILEDFGKLIDGAYALIAPSRRSIGGIIPNVVIQETHNDGMTITDHPVEAGAPISDHAFKRPVEVEMRCGWSDSTAKTSGYINMVYNALLALQAAREPFDVYTGKRAYRNMMLSNISVTTDEKSEYALMVTATLREVIITSVRRGSGPSTREGLQASGGVKASSASASATSEAAFPTDWVSAAYGD